MSLPSIPLFITLTAVPLQRRKKPIVQNVWLLWYTYVAPIVSAPRQTCLSPCRSRGHPTPVRFLPLPQILLLCPTHVNIKMRTSVPALQFLFFVGKAYNEIR